MGGSVSETYSELYRRALLKAHYKIVGRHGHSAVSTCQWTKESIRGGEECYKARFYGIESHRCLQLTPCVLCNQRCVFCWRPTELSPKNFLLKEFDEPKELLDEAILAQRKLLEGFGGIIHRISEKRFREAQDPRHVAISLAGEPTLYPKIGGLVEECDRRALSSFLVTNGTMPERLSSMSVLPTQLYVSLEAFDEESYKKLDNPFLENGWEKVLETFSLLPSLSTRRAVRITLVRGLNDKSVEGFADVLNGSEVDFVEVKSYMCVGYSRYRLTMDNMLSHEEVVSFSKKLAGETGLEFLDDKAVSRVALLGSGRKKTRIF